jgi:hypothetical protein
LRRRYSSFLVLVALALLATSQAVRATGTSPATQTEIAGACGATVEDALKQARLSLKSSDSGSERAALGCLIEAVNTLSGQRAEAVRSDGTHVLAAPSYKGPLQ